MLLTSGAAQALAPHALPEGWYIRHGHVAISRDDRGMRIVQAGDRAIVDWRTFDIGAHASVHVLQHSTEAVLLNRVTGRTASDIAGALRGNGHVYLINPNGIHISPGGSIETAAFVASTLDIDDRHFMNGTLHFQTAPHSATGTIVHDGRIDLYPGGFAALLGYRIEQRGLICAPLGQVALGAGTSAVLVPRGVAFLAMAPVSGIRPPREGAAIDLRGAIEAAGGQVHIEAPMTLPESRMPEEAMALGGAIRTPQWRERNGLIRISGNGGVVRLSGVLDASSNDVDADVQLGGVVAVHGQRVVLQRMGIDVSGTAGGGKVILSTGTMTRPDGVRPAAAGQDWPILVEGAASINANATRYGKGGDIRVMSDGPVVILGSIQTRDAVQVTLPTPPDVMDRTASPSVAPMRSFRLSGGLPLINRPPIHPMAQPAERSPTQLFAQQPATASAVPATVVLAMPPAMPSDTATAISYTFPSGIPPSIPSALPLAAAAADALLESPPATAVLGLMRNDLTPPWPPLQWPHSADTPPELGR